MLYIRKQLCQDNLPNYILSNAILPNFNFYVILLLKLPEQL